MWLSTTFLLKNLSELELKNYQPRKINNEKKMICNYLKSSWHIVWIQPFKWILRLFLHLKDHDGICELPQKMTPYEMTEWKYAK